MPATEKTWRSMKPLHLIFGVSSMVLLGATLWMLAADHWGRPWRDYQQKSRGIEMWTFENQIRSMNLATAKAIGNRLQDELNLARAVEPDPELLDRFRQAVLSQDSSADLSDFDGAREALKEPLSKGRTARQKYIAIRDEADSAAARAAAASAAAEEAQGNADKASGKVAKAKNKEEAATLQAAADVASRAAEAAENAASEALVTSQAAAESASAELTVAQAAEAFVGTARDELFEVMDGIVRAAKIREANLDTQKKFRSADYDAVRSKLGLAHSNHLPDAEIKQLQAAVDLVKSGEGDNPKSLDRLVSDVEEANADRLDLQNMLASLTNEENERLAKFNDHTVAQAQIQTTIDERKDNWFKRIVGGPILSAFDTGEVGIQQIWCPDLKINFNHKKVARFDRCISCHTLIDKSIAGAPTTPAFPKEQSRTVLLATPSKESSEYDYEIPANKAGEMQVDRLHGMLLVQGGPLNTSDVAVGFAWPGSAAAKAGLRIGDVIEKVGGVHVENLGVAMTHLIETVAKDAAIKLTVRRGLPHPYAAHPRLDLYGSSSSPHPFAEVGCTICHDGQGSATAIPNVQHTPNDEAQQKAWAKKYGWAHNHHWPYPMYPKRFRESNCLKCHHDVLELAGTEKFPESSAPKLMAGYNLLRTKGCFGCHEINGFDGPDRRIGPDLRVEPNYYGAAAQLHNMLPGDDDLKADTNKLTKAVAENEAKDDTRKDEDKALRKETKTLKKEDEAANAKRLAEIDARRKTIKAARKKLDAKIEALEGEVTQAAIKVRELAEMKRASQRLSAHTDDAATRHRLLALLERDAARPEAMRILSPETRYLMPILADVETPGSMRKVGPSLRHVGSKNDRGFLVAWLLHPKKFRPSTQMPQFFGLHKHLSKEDAAQTKRREAVEVRTIAHYLLKKSQEFKMDPLPEGASPDRGKALFQTQGCLACHQHKDFPAGKAEQGPELSQIGAKLATKNGRDWLYNWIRKPNRYHARTKMPILFLGPEDQPDGNDPAADIATYLLSAKGNGINIWKTPLAVPDDQLSDEFRGDLDELVSMFLTAALRSSRMSDKFLKRSASARASLNKDEKRWLDDVSNTLQGDEAILKGLDADNSLARKMLYVGRRTITRYGCSGCHDIPGFEAATPIGTGLADWARKDVSKLAFEHIGSYLGGHGDDHGDHGHAEHAEKDDDHKHQEQAEAIDPYFLHGLTNHYHLTRNGFLNQKLREPRSYDHKKTANKPYLDRLRMPQFNFRKGEIEQLMTFVLGLTAEPPAPKYVYQPDKRQQAINQGMQIVDKFNCAGCHVLEMDRWNIEYNPGQFADAGVFTDYEFLRKHVSAKTVDASLKTDAAGKLHAELIGQPLRDYKTGLPAWFDEEGSSLDRANEDNLPVHYKFDLFKPALLDGKMAHVGGAAMLIAKSQIEGDPLGARGGNFSRLLFPVVTAGRQEIKNDLKAAESWGWLPPPLIGEGAKVQTAWLHDFLLEPYRIRPAAVLRMPKFNMSPAEATKIVNYFAARDNAEYPYENDERTRVPYLEEKEDQYLHRLKASLDAGALEKRTRGGGDVRLEDALRIVVNNDFCVKCHLVGDFAPKNDPKALAPNLDNIYRRLRPTYLRDWIANPKRILPYTSMPQNIPPDKAASQELFHGAPADQVEGLTDLLLNYGRLMESRTSISELVPKPAAAAPPAVEGEDEP